MPIVTDEENQDLYNQPKEEEIKEAVFLIDPNSLVGLMVLMVNFTKILMNLLKRMSATLSKVFFGF